MAEGAGEIGRSFVDGHERSPQDGDSDEIKGMGLHCDALMVACPIGLESV